MCSRNATLEVEIFQSTCSQDALLTCMSRCRNEDDADFIFEVAVLSMVDPVLTLALFIFLRDKENEQGAKHFFARRIWHQFYRKVV